MTALPTLCPGCDRLGQIRDGRNWWCADCFKPALWRDDEPEPRYLVEVKRTSTGLTVPAGYGRSRTR